MRYETDKYANVDVRDIVNKYITFYIRRRIVIASIRTVSNKQKPRAYRVDELFSIVANLKLLSSLIFQIQFTIAFRCRHYLFLRNIAF